MRSVLRWLPAVLTVGVLTLALGGGVRAEDAGPLERKELDKRLGIRRVRSGGVTYRDFPPLTEARAKFAARFRNGWPWQMDIQDWAMESAEAALKAKMEIML